MAERQRQGDPQADPVVRRLDLLVSVALDGLAPGGQMSVAEKIQRLTGLGMSAAEIAGIVRKPTNYVTATQSRGRTTRRTK